MNIGTIAVLAIVIAIVCLAVKSLFKGKGACHGCSSCNSDSSTACSGCCSSSKSCHGCNACKASELAKSLSV